MKVGTPQEMASILEEISKENHLISSGHNTEIGTDPELDEFMVKTPQRKTHQHTHTHI